MPLRLREILESGIFAVTAELGPPQSASADAIRKKAVHFKHGVHAVNITDNQTAIVRLSSIAAARILLEEGLEPVIQMTCRDRNRIAIQSDLLGAAALGIESVLCLTGDYVTFGNHPEARPVYDLDSIQLIHLVSELAEGRFLSGETMKTVPGLFPGGAANPFAEPLDFRVTRLEKKVRAGARFIQTQAVFDVQRFSAWMKQVREAGLHRETAILAGVLPVRSVKALHYMKNEVPGMRIPENLIHRMEQADDPREEGVCIAVETIQALRETEGVRGVHLMPLMWESITPVILERAGLLSA